MKPRRTKLHPISIPPCILPAWRYASQEVDRPSFHLPFFWVRYVLALLAFFALLSAAPPASPALSTASGSYLHRINLYDHQNRLIDPAKSTTPYAPVITCAKCHDPHTLRCVWHPGVAGGYDLHRRPGQEPWIWTDPVTGTQVPLGRDAAATWRPQDFGLADAQLLRTFAGRTVGGWKVAAELQTDCLSCHGAQYDSAEWSRQVARGNLLAAATLAGGLGHATPDTHPAVTYTVPIIGANRIFIDIPHQIPSARCLACHGDQAAPDIHVSRGLLCVDCHNQTTSGANPGLSCQGCHLDGNVPLTLGSTPPRPAHRGLPPTHLQRLDCTACHSGPFPTATLHNVGTSRSHGPTPDSLPLLRAPVFLGPAPIRPHAVLWPAFWARIRLSDRHVTPLSADELDKLIAPRLAGGPLNAARVEAALAAEPTGETALAYVAAGTIRYRDPAGRLCVLSDHPAGAMVAWPASHGVRPAREALGAKGCNDCHSHEAAFFFGHVAPGGPFGDVPGVPMHQFQPLQGLSPFLLPNLFVLRPVVVAILFAACGATAMGLLAGFRRGRFAAGPRWLYVLTAATGGILAATGLFAWASGGWGWGMLVHIGVGVVFAAGCAVLIILGVRERGASLQGWQRTAAVGSVTVGWVAVGSVAVSMAGLVGSSAMETLGEIHRWAAAGLGLAGLCWLIGRQIQKKRAKNAPEAARIGP